MLGRFEVRRLLGKSSRTMTWLAHDLVQGQAVMLTLPRLAIAPGPGLEGWLDRVRHAARLRHPRLAPVVAVGVEEHWPYVAIDAAAGTTLAEYLEGTPAPAPAEAAGWMCGILEGLACAHEAGVSHGDVQLHHVLIDDRGHACLAGLGVAVPAGRADPLGPGMGAARGHERAMAVDPTQLQRQREGASQDLLGCGALLHRLLSAEGPLGEQDISRVIERIAPRGREYLRLPWTTPHPIPEPLRAIANRATDRHPAHRYLSARSMLRALQGWLEALSKDDGGALALMLDRLRTVGHLPATPGVVERVARLALDDQQRTHEIAAQVLQDVGLTLELLRQVNTAFVRGGQMSGNGAVLTLHRAVALVGLQGVRQAALALRPWPGPLDEVEAQALGRLMQTVRMASFTAQALRPAGYDPDVAFLLATMQNLGRLLVHYHFPAEAAQIRQLMKPVPSPTDEGRLDPGLDEREASFAVLGIDLEEIGPAVARLWGLTDDVALMIRRLPVDRPVFMPDSDATLLRATASAGNEAVDALEAGDARTVARELQRVAQRYARALGLKPGDLQEALQFARASVRSSQAQIGDSAGESGHAAEDLEAAVEATTRR